MSDASESSLMRQAAYTVFHYQMAAIYVDADSVTEEGYNAAKGNKQIANRGC
jgi:hypothetical protein